MRPMFQRCFVIAGSMLVAAVFQAQAQTGVTLTEQDGKVRVEIGGKLFTEYHFKEVPRPFLYPIHGPGELPMTRNYPMKKVEGEDTDHVHHRALWYSHGSVNGVDFWSESARAGKIVHDKFLKVSSGEKHGELRTRNHWVAPGGKVICSDERTIRFHAGSNPRMLDFEITLIASEGEVTLGDTKEGTMAIRVNESMRLRAMKGKESLGRIVNSEGVRDGATWGKRAAWTDYFGPVEGKTMGIAIFDHPTNPRHPTWWHVRDYGLFAANPFGVHDFEKKPANTGNMVIPAGEKVTFRYRFVFHEGDHQQAGIAGLYDTWASQSLK
jgi:hypothetical protein